MSSFTRYRHLDKKSEDAQSYQILLRAFDRVDDLLASLSDGVRVYRGLGAFQLQPPTAEEAIEPIAPSTLDYLIRKGQIEIQVDLVLPPTNSFSLPRETMEQYRRVMLGNPKTRAIIVVWATEQLESVVFEVSQIRHWLEAKDEKVAISSEALCPLEETLESVWQKYERTFWHERDIQERRRPEFDLLEAFRHSLVERHQHLVKTAGRRTPERRLAILSIAKAEIASLADLVAQCIDERLSLEELQEVIADMSQHVGLD